MARCTFHLRLPLGLAVLTTASPCLSSSIDPDMTWAAVRYHLSRMLNKDWRGEAEAVIEGNGGLVPAPTVEFLQRCFGERQCKTSLDYDSRHYHMGPLVTT